MKTFTRQKAIELLKELYSDEDYIEDAPDIDAMTDEELEAEMCLSGIIHDEDMGGII